MPPIQVHCTLTSFWYTHAARGSFMLAQGLVHPCNQLALNTVGLANHCSVADCLIYSYWVWCICNTLAWAGNQFRTYYTLLQSSRGVIDCHMGHLINLWQNRIQAQISNYSFSQLWSIIWNSTQHVIHFGVMLCLPLTTLYKQLMKWTMKTGVVSFYYSLALKGCLAMKSWGNTIKLVLYLYPELPKYNRLFFIYSTVASWIWLKAKHNDISLYNNYW